MSILIWRGERTYTEVKYLCLRVRDIVQAGEVGEHHTTQPDSSGKCNRYKHAPPSLKYNDANIVCNCYYTWE